VKSGFDVHGAKFRKQEGNMPKLKTNRSAAKRLRVTGSGKIRRNKAGRRHILTSKEKKRKRNLGKPTLVHPGDEKRMARLLGM
jgi:large subunit ribosomal protein L35